jgi:two-component system, cell cycle sensor histidine kinase and response regulator CckA
MAELMLEEGVIARMVEESPRQAPSPEPLSPNYLPEGQHGAGAPSAGLRGHRIATMNIPGRSEAYLQMAVRAAKVGLWDWDLLANKVVFSPEWKSQLGYGDEEISNEFGEWESRVHPEDLPRINKLLADYFANPWPDYEAEFRMRHKNGSWRWILAQADLLRDEEGRSTHMIGSHIDITEHVRFFEAMDRVNRAIQSATGLEQMMSDVLDLLLDIFECDRAWLVYPCDPDAASWRVPMERTRPEYPGGHAAGLDFPMEPDVKASMGMLLNANGPVKIGPGTEHALPAVAAAFGVQSFIAMTLYPKGDKPYMFGLHQCSRPRIWTPEEEKLFREIGRRMTDGLTGLLAYRNLQQSQQAYASLVNNIDGIVWELDVPTFHFTFVSPPAERLLGYPIERWIEDANFWQEHLHPQDRNWVVDSCLKATRENRDHDFQYRMIAADGRIVWLHDLVTVVVENGRAVKLRGIMVDVTESKRSEEALALFRTLIDRATDAIEVVDPESGRFLDVNERACRTHGYTREEYLNLKVSDVEVGTDLSSPEAWRSHVGAIRQAGFTALEGQHRRKDGSVFPVEVNANYIHLDNGYVVAVVRDVTERKRAEEALRESEQRFRQVTESIDEVFWLTNVPKDEMIYVSPAYEKIWGLSCESLYAKPDSWMDAIHAEDQQRVRKAALTRQATGDYNVEYRIVRPDGSERWIHDRAFPITDAEGRVYRIAGVAADITVRRRLEDQFRQAQKMEAVGQLAGGIAHDFNNLLSVIHMQSSVLLEDTQSDAETREGIREIMAAAERAANLTRQLLTFSRREVKQARDLDLTEVIGTMTRLLRRVLGEDVALESRFAPSLPLVHADPGMMEQVLLNLAVNARDAMANGGRLTVTLDPVEVDAERAAGKPGVMPGSFVRLSASDTGCGISSDNLPRIFEPFFTTKEIGKGTGLGLANVFGITQQHHGWVEVESEVGRGTTFHVFLPASPSSVSQPLGLKQARKARGGSEVILLVEDEDSVRAIGRAVLQRHGYRVIEAASATAAVQALEGQTAAIDLLLTDLILPGGISGRELADLLVARQPSLKVIYTSGYSSEVVNRQLPLGAGRNFLQKPYSVLDLAETVRRCLDGVSNEDSL